MRTALIYNLPGIDAAAAEGFAALKKLMACNQSRETTNGKLYLLPPGNPTSEKKAFVTVFELDPKSERTKIILRTDEANEIPASFFAGSLEKSNALTLVEATEKLAGKINAVDHTGIIAPNGISSEEWKLAVNIFASHILLYDYPDAPEYDRKSMLWLFAVPKGNTPATTKHQPKFELASDIDSRGASVLQIDMETTLSPDEIMELFPHSYEQRGLGEYFRSVDVVSPWPGIASIRLDLRPDTSIAPNEWNTAEWVMDEGELVRPNSKQSSLPAYKR